MYITGFAESISDLLSLRNIWAVRGISVAVLLGLLGINLAGVKWIIRLQLLLLLLLAVSTLDFVVGSFTHLDPGKPWEFSRRPSRVCTAFSEFVDVSLQDDPPICSTYECVLFLGSEWVGVLVQPQRPESPSSHRHFHLAHFPCVFLFSFYYKIPGNLDKTIQSNWTDKHQIHNGD